MPTPNSLGPDMTPIQRALAAYQRHHYWENVKLMSGDQPSRLSEDTPLHLAAQYGELEYVRAFLDSGAKVDVLGDMSSTPLHLASQRGHDAIVALLIERDADKNAVNEFGNTPLMEAQRAGKGTTAHLLESLGARRRLVV